MQPRGLWLIDGGHKPSLFHHSPGRSGSSEIEAAQPDSRNENAKSPFFFWYNLSTSTQN